MAVKPTRMGLLLTKRKLKLASKGHKLLKEKRDALIMEFFATLKEIKKLRSEVQDDIVKAQSALYKAQALQGEVDIERFSSAISAGTNVSFSKKSIMGVELPIITDITVKGEWYGYFESSVELDSAILLYRKLFPRLMRLSEKQLALKRFAEEIKKTKRKVNSLEYIIIPKLEKVKSMITLKLEELERENFTRLKKIKAKVK